MCYPLIQQGLAMHEHESVSSTLGGEVGAQDSLADSGRRDEDSDISGSTPSRRFRWLWVVAGAAAIGVTVVLTIVLTAGLR